MESPVDKSVFISYRREDSLGDTSRLAASLKQYIHEGRIFFDSDKDKIPYGGDFPKVLKQNVKQCHAALIIIGKKWLSPKEDGTIPLMDELNWVRIEIATALRHNKLVIPILIDGAKMPSKNDVPAALAPLLNKQAKEIYYRTWDNDVKDLADFLRSQGIIFKEDDRFIKNTGRLFNKWTLAMLIAVAIGLYLVMQAVMKPDENINSPKENTIPGKFSAKNYGVIPVNPKTLIPIKYNISATWKPENGTGKYYYKIINTITGKTVEIWDNGLLVAREKLCKQTVL